MYKKHAKRYTYMFYNFESAMQSVFRESRHKISADGWSKNLRRGTDKVQIRGLSLKLINLCEFVADFSRKYSAVISVVSI